jgi:hypothetical protein
MNCLSETEIQQYIDQELAEDRFNEAEQHLKNCSVCMETYNQAKESKSQIFAFLDEYTSFDSPLEVPAFKIKTKKRSLVKYILISSIAASVLLFIGIGIRINNQKNMQKQMNNITKASYEITRNTDLNKMVQNKQIIVVITNSSGEVIESSFTE